MEDFMGQGRSRVLRHGEMDKFSYAYLNHHLRTVDDGVQDDSSAYTAYISRDNQAFITIINTQYQIAPRFLQDRNIKTICQYGLKFHIALPEWNRPQFEKGWSIVKDILFRHRVTEFKVIKEPHRMSDNPGQRGKDITIYASSNPNKSLADWLSLLQEITLELTLNRIPPGYRPPERSEQERGMIREEPIPGSNYISYRYDNDNGRWPRANPCDNDGFIVDVPNQLPIRAWKDSRNNHRFICNIM